MNTPISSLLRASRLLVLITVSAWLPASSVAAAEQSNILWITCEDMSPFLGAYGDPAADTPHLDAFAKRGITFTRAWSNMPICSPARSTLITGHYATSLGTMNLRSQVPQSPDVRPLPVLLREQGYYCTNNVKTDYNFSPAGLWDEQSSSAHWRNRPDPQTPFFHVRNFQLTHEGPTQTLRHTDFESYAGQQSPQDVPMPPYFPDHPKMREVMAHHYDLIGQLDRFVQDMLDELAEAGEAENTVVFFFSDHGSGLPRYKRWLYETGLKVPLIIHVPEKFSHLSPWPAGTVTDAPVGFVDYAATVLALTGTPLPQVMAGKPIMGDPDQISYRNSRYLFGSRDRADDVEAVSRSVRDERFHYIRHYQPFRPYIRSALIFNPANKQMFAPLWEFHDQPETYPEVAKMFAPLPFEELYDLDADPHELNNLAADPAYTEEKTRLSTVLREHIIAIHDTGLLPEGEMMRRAAHDSVFDMARDPIRYDVAGVLAAAEIASSPHPTVAVLKELAQSRDPAQRYWAALGLLNAPLGDTRSLAQQLLHDANPMVSSVAAEAILRENPAASTALDTLIQITSDHLDSEPTIALRAARSLVEIGEAAAPAKEEILTLLARIEGPVWKYYRNSGYPMFIGMSLDQALVNIGAGRDLSRN
ncbi:MAG: sulfatase-like hydrolase/transferase [Synoicihabitans sp.]